MSRLIDADKLKDAVYESFAPYHREWARTIYQIQRVIDAQPSIETVPVLYGEWIEDAIPFCNVCPVCKSIVERGSVRNGGELNFCPNCGADMRKKE